MHTGQLVFAQLMREFPLKAFSRFVAVRKGQHKVKDFSCLDQFFVQAFAQLTGRDSLRSIELNLRIKRQYWYHMGLRCKNISRNTIANANSTRPWQMFFDLAQQLIGTAKKLYVEDLLDAELAATLNATIYALDSSTVDLCLSLFSWAPFRETKAAIKLHTLLDLRGAIPTFIHISDGKMADVKMLDILVEQGYIEAGAFYVMDRAYIDFSRLFLIEKRKAYFVTRTKSNTIAETCEHRAVEPGTGITSDERVFLLGEKSLQDYPNELRRVRYTDQKTGKKLVFLTNNLTLPALTIAALYKNRWQVELFFKWIKQHLRIKVFLGTNENAVKTQIWCAIATYVLIAITKKRLNLPQSLHEILRVLDLNIFESTPIPELFRALEIDREETVLNEQYSLF